jgi:hypothetical protein
MRFFATAGLLALMLGCEGTALVQPAAVQPPDERQLFGPVAMKLHPIFTQVKSFSGGATPDGIEAVLEFDDQFGDPTKAAGAVIFELFEFRTGYPDHRGERLIQPWTASLATVSQQHGHWRREIDAYSFLLADDQVHTDRTYVLTATFEPLTGKRLFSQTVIGAQTVKK